LFVDWCGTSQAENRISELSSQDFPCKFVNWAVQLLAEGSSAFSLTMVLTIFAVTQRDTRRTMPYQSQFFIGIAPWH
jgi:hypothetical protein